LSISVTCPACESKIRAPENMAGRKAKCPKCGQSVAVPLPSGPASDPSKSVPVLLPASVDDDDDDRQLPAKHKPAKSNKGLIIGLSVGGGILLVGLVVALMVLTKSGTLTAKEKAAAADAIKALGRIEAAVEVGVNYQQYGQLVIDAKAVVNDATRTLPAGEMSTNLTEAIEAYADAGAVWGKKIEFPTLGLRGSFGDGAIISRYNLQVDDKQQAAYSKAMQIIWGVGATKLAKARSLQ
jgi:hypothetical protein